MDPVDARPSLSCQTSATYHRRPSIPSSACFASLPTCQTLLCSCSRSYNPYVPQSSRRSVPPSPSCSAYCATRHGIGRTSSHCTKIPAVSTNTARRWPVLRPSASPALYHSALACAIDTSASAARSPVDQALHSRPWRAVAPSRAPSPDLYRPGHTA